MASLTNFKQPISDFIRLLPQVHILRIYDEFYNDKRLTDEEVVKLSEDLKNKPYISTLILNGKNIKDKGAVALSEVKSLSEISLINYEGAAQSSTITHIGATALAESFLTDLNVTGHYLIGDEGFRALSYSQTIVRLNMMGCGISAKGTADFFKINNKVNLLNLACNKIQDIGLSTIGLNHNIEYLDLTDCAITKAGVELIAKNKSLKKLNLSWNSFEGSNWAAALVKHPTLISLNLRGCDLEYAALEFLINSKLKNLYLDDNKTTRKAFYASRPKNGPQIQLMLNTGRKDINTLNNLKESVRAFDVICMTTLPSAI